MMNFTKWTRKHTESRFSQRSIVTTAIFMQNNYYSILLFFVLQLLQRIHQLTINLLQIPHITLQLLDPLRLLT